MIETWIFATVALVVMTRTINAYRAGYWYRHATSGIIAMLYIAVLAIPGLLQSRGVLTSKLADAGVLAPPGKPEIASLLLEWALQLGLVAVVEQLVVAVVRRHESAQSRRLPHERLDSQTTPFVVGEHYRRSVFTLIGIGAVATLVLPTADLTQRGEGGNGLAVLLQGCLLSGVALLVYNRHFGRRHLTGITLGAAALLIMGGVRSPLVILIIAVVLGRLRSSADDRLKLGYIAAGLPLFGVVGAFMSAYRGNIARGQGLSNAAILSDVLSDPVSAIYGAGIDTLDGYRFSEMVSNQVAASLWDFSKIVTTFIPRSVWPTKPPALSVSLSETFLGYEASGMYLSPVGYLRLVGGSYTAALVLLVVIVALLVAGLQRYKDGFASCYILLATFRFFLGGDQFDFYYVLALAIPVGVVYLALRRRNPNTTTGRRSTVGELR